MNEMIFFGHVGAVILFVLGAAKLGRGALISLVGLQAVIANLCVLKQVDLFGLSVTAADVYIVGSLLALNLLQEYWGREAAKQAIWVSLGSIVFFGIVGQFQLAYLPNHFDSTQAAYERLLSLQPRLLGASLVAYFISQQLDIRLFGRLRKTGWPLSMRSGLTLVCSQACDTAIFGLLGLWGVVGAVWQVMAMSYVIKLIAIGSMIPFSGMVRREI